MYQQTQNIRITFIRRRPNGFDLGPTMYKCFTNVLCLLGYDNVVSIMIMAVECHNRMIMVTHHDGKHHDHYHGPANTNSSNCLLEKQTITAACLCMIAVSTNIWATVSLTSPTVIL